MSLYQPDVGAIATGTSFTALLSQRDLSLQVPINYVSVPGVATSAVCFANGTYEDTAAAKCFSNLLATGFRRFELDLYWDASREIWSFCPVELGDAGSQDATTTDLLSPTSQNTMASLASGQITGRAAVQTVESTFGIAPWELLIRRQTSELLPASSSVASSSSSSLPLVTTTSRLNGSSMEIIATTTSSSNVALPTASNGMLIEVGPFSCTPNVNFAVFTNVMAAYLVNTETNLNATLRYLIMNLHAAAPASDPTGSAKRPPDGSLPQDRDLLGPIISSSMSPYLYTPSDLLQQRSDLDATGSGWFSVPYTDQPSPSYFEVTTIGGKQTSPDGWPSESYIEGQKAKRMLASYGNIDPQLAGYNFSGDSAAVFPQGFLRSPVPPASGGVQGASGCFFQPNEFALSAVNSSWATTSLADEAQSSLFQNAQNLTSCGISPILNETLGNVTAADDYRPYQAYVLNAVWPWAPGEPRNYSSTNTNNQQYRCAALNATQGQLQVADCDEAYYAACRVYHQPYTWQMSDTRASYTKQSMGCPGNTSFSVPRTALEKTYLLSAWNTFRTTQADLEDVLLFVNFNDLDASTCWVVGANTTCPYLSQQQSDTREVVVPTVAAVIVFVLAALTVFVKCAANRRSTLRRRRRLDDNWDYEGVPS